MLELIDVYKTFNAGTVNEKVALSGLNFHLKPGEFVTVIGGNGAGKSTMLNSVAERRKEIHIYTSLGLAPRHVGMGMDDLTPRFETGLDLRFDGRTGGPAFLRADLLVEPHSEQFHLHPLDLGSLGG